MLDVLELESKKTRAELQAADITALGHLLLQIACRSSQATQQRTW